MARTNTDAFLRDVERYIRAWALDAPLPDLPQPADNLTLILLRDSLMGLRAVVERRINAVEAECARQIEALEKRCKEALEAARVPREQIAEVIEAEDIPF